MNLDEDIKTLMDLGLTLVQAKTYLTLVSADSLTIKEISKLSGIPRTDLYRVMNELAEQSLIEKIISTPQKFKAVPIDDVLTNLITKKKQETKKITKEARNLRKRFEKKPKEKLENAAKFILIPSKRIPNKIAEAIDQTNNSVNLVVNLARFSRGFDVFSEKLKGSWQRKVRWRIIIEISPNTNLPNFQINAFQNNPLCEIRYYPYPVNTATGIYDQKQVFIIENPKAGLSDSPALWTNNKSLISLVKDYFEILWVTASKEPKFEID